MPEPHQNDIQKAVRSRRGWKFRIAAVLLSLMLFLLLMEGIARLMVFWLWKPEQIEANTEFRTVVGHVAKADDLPYVNAPDLKSPRTLHNSLGLRGPEIQRRKPAGTIRVVCLGASVTYGFPCLAAESYPARLQALLDDLNGVKVEVLNAGVVGWVSTETRRFFETRLLPLEPDLVIHYEGRNEMFPEGYDNFDPEYRHYRHEHFEFEFANRAHKSLFRWSHLAMVLCTWRGERFGWSSMKQNPVSACIRFENKPNAQRFARNLSDPAHFETYRRNLVAIADQSRGAGARFALVTMAFDKKRFGTRNLDTGEGFADPAQSALDRNNQIAREVAESTGSILIEAAQLANESSLLQDDCHFTVAGYQRLAEIIHEGIRATLENRSGK